jgi:hypothetical protein
MGKHQNKKRVVTTSPQLKIRVVNAAIIATFITSAAWAEDKSDTSAFELGTVLVVAKRLPTTEIGDVGGDQVASVVTSKDLLQFNRNNVGDALNLLSGVTLSTNSRNEKTVAVRGFDSRQVPLFIDGIPVYVPYDGYVDFNRFSTADLAAIQVAKGFSSLAYGPNTLGGAINLISRKPKTFEADAMVGVATGSEKQTSANVGTNQARGTYKPGFPTYRVMAFPCHRISLRPVQKMVARETMPIARIVSFPSNSALLRMHVTNMPLAITSKMERRDNLLQQFQRQHVTGNGLTGIKKVCTLSRTQRWVTMNRSKSDCSMTAMVTRSIAIQMIVTPSSRSPVLAASVPDAVFMTTKQMAAQLYWSHSAFRGRRYV